MGREVRRVPLNFDWPINKTWEDTELSPATWVPCPTCGGDGIHPDYREEYKRWQRIEPPKGKGYQMWETTSGGSPISPPFATPEELARWLSGTKASVFGQDTWTYDQWLAFIRGKRKGGA